MHTPSTLDPAEIAKFAKTAHAWWDEKGPFAPLHRLNPARLAYIRDRAAARFGPPASRRRPLAGLRVLDIGCGGGLVSEPLARLGARLTAIDAEGETLKIAQAHAQAQGLSITYSEASAEDLVHKGLQFDLVIAMEIIEHTADVGVFLTAAAALTAPGGILILSTINRTWMAKALAIGAAEHLLRWVPAGTHDPDKLVKPEEIAGPLRALGLEVDAPVGLSLDFGAGAFKLSTDVRMNYLIAAEKR